MSEQELKELIDRLRREVDALPNDDVDARQRLDAIISVWTRNWPSPAARITTGW